VAVRVHVSDLALGEGHADVPNLRFGHLVVDVCPEGLDLDLDLRDGQHRPLDDGLLGRSRVDLEVLNVS